MKILSALIVLVFLAGCAAQWELNYASVEPAGLQLVREENEITILKIRTGERKGM